MNVGVGLHDRMDRLLFARGWLNAGVAPLDLRAGQSVVARFAVKMDLEPGEYTLACRPARPCPTSRARRAGTSTSAATASANCPMPPSSRSSPGPAAAASSGRPTCGA